MVKLNDLAKGTYWDTTGLSLVEGVPTKVMLTIKPEILQAYGKVHGGAIAGLLDSAVAAAVNFEIGEEYGAATVELKINYLKPVTAGKLLAQAEILSKGKTLIVAEAKAWDDDECLVAVAIATFRVFSMK